MTVIDVDKLTLARGSHSDCEDGMCLFEAYSMIARNEHTDHCPPDVSQVLHTYGMRLNDSFPDDRRQELKRFLPGADGKSVLSGTRNDGLDETRSYLALDWLIRTYTPAWLDLAGLTAEATALRDLRRIVDLVATQAAGPVVRDAQTKAAAARDAAGAVAGAAARDAAWAVAGDAARAAAGDAARAVAGDAAWAVAAPAWAVAGAAAWAVAGAAAGDAARAVAGDAAWAALKPTVEQLQTSAIALYDAMIRPEVTA